MPDTTVGFDHVHLVSQDPLAAASWYVDRLGGKIVKTVEMKGAPQVYISFGDAMVLICGERPDEQVAGKPGLEWESDFTTLTIAVLTR